MSPKSYILYRGRCEKPPTARPLYKSPRPRSDFPRLTASVKSKFKISSLYDRYRKRHINMDHIRGIKCASCKAAAVAAAQRARYRRSNKDAEGKGPPADYLGREDQATVSNGRATYNKRRTTAEEAASPEDQSDEEEEAEEGEGEGGETEDKDYDSDNTITERLYKYSDHTPNGSYEEREELTNSSQDSQDSNAERINHDDWRWPPPGSCMPYRGNETPSTASGSQSSADGDDEETKEKNFRDRADRKYLLGLRRQEERFWG